MLNLVDLRVSRAVCAADMLAFVANGLADLCEVGLADMASASHSETGPSEDQICAARIAAPLEVKASIGQVGIGDNVTLVAVWVVAPVWSANYIVIDILVSVQTNTYLAAGMRAVGTGSSGVDVAITAVTVPAHTKAEWLILTEHRFTGLRCPHLPGFNVHAKARGNGLAALLGDFQL